MKRGGTILMSTAVLATAACAGQQAELQIRQKPSAIAQGSRPVPLRIAEARGQLALGNVALALESFRKAQREDPNSVDALAGMATCYEMMGRYELARRYYESALALAPADLQLLAAFAGSLQLQGNADEALKVRREIALRSAPPAATPQPKPQQLAQAPAASPAQPRPQQPVAAPVAPPAARLKPKPQQLAQVAVAAAVQPPAKPAAAAVAAVAAAPAPAPAPAEQVRPAAVPAAPQPAAAAQAQAAPGPREAEPAKAVPSVSVKLAAAAPAAAARSVTVKLPPAQPVAANAVPSVAAERAQPVPAKAAQLVAANAAPSVGTEPAQPAPGKPAQPVAAKPAKPGTGPRLERLSLGEIALVTSPGPVWRPMVVAQSAQSTTVRWVPLREASAAQVRVLNAARVHRLAARTRAWLAARGWRSMAIGDAPTTLARSVILYPRGQRGLARTLSNQFGFAAEERPDVKVVTMLLGRDAARIEELRPRDA